MESKPNSKEGLRKVSRLITEIEIINFEIDQGVSGPTWQRLTLAKNDFFARIVSIISVIKKSEMEEYATKYRRNSK